MAKQTTTQAPSLPDAVDRGDWNIILEARRSGTPWVQLRTHQGMPAIIRAVVDGNTLMTRNMLQAEAPVGSVVLRDGTWMSPLWAAIERNQPAIVRLLLEAGADPNLAKPGEVQPLTLASQQRMADACTALLRHGAHPASDIAPVVAWMRHGIDSTELAQIEEVLDVATAFVKAGWHLPKDWPEWLRRIGEDPRWTGETFQTRWNLLQRLTDRHVIERSIQGHAETAGPHARI